MLQDILIKYVKFQSINKVCSIVIKSVIFSQEVHTALLGADGEEKNGEGSEEGKEKEEEEKESVDENPTPGKLAPP